ncbi:hypothetical protein KDH_75130 [Dictyobacter sp. S3.2.2.5]|uniref:N-acetyltransferase domain-containing protein n=1 Tax=Dictyobacter halimunensis TaxID=3026934 RepID=A0ABQ6G2E3_9CHLR|nr:hypothetical protein KDH_75130 [Dictyobacter sp. S3.2.2.5]
MHEIPDIVPLRKEDAEVAGEILEQAFAADPLNVYTVPDPGRRQEVFRWLFTQLVRGGDAVYVTSGPPRGVAVWIAPQTSGDAVESESDREQMEHVFGPDAYRRFVCAFEYFESNHRRLMRGSHWYLQLLGVEPRWQGQGIGGALIAPVLQEADHQGLPCYLETFVAGNVLFYQRHGFQVVDASREPVSQVPCWSMRREPR